MAVRNFQESACCRSPGRVHDSNQPRRDPAGFAETHRQLAEQKQEARQEPRIAGQDAAKGHRIHDTRKLHSMPSPVFFTMRPRYSLIFGSAT